MGKADHFARIAAIVGVIASLLSIVGFLTGNSNLPGLLKRSQPTHQVLAPIEAPPKKKSLLPDLKRVFTLPHRGNSDSAH